MLPIELRPARLCSASTSGAYGAPLCRSALTTFTMERRPADVGLVFTSAMSGHSLHDLDLGHGRIGHHLEHDLLAGLAHEGRLLGDHRGDDHLHQSFLVHASASSRCRTAAFVMSTLSNCMRLTGSAWRTSSTIPFGRLREER